MMHSRGVPQSALQLVVSEGLPVSETLVADERVSGVIFTGSTETARSIATVLNAREAYAPLIAETGGLNAMIVDSTALPEQVVDDVVASAFHSAGQRCSAMRILYVQNDVADEMIEKIKGKMAELVVADPISLATDIGPIIDVKAIAGLEKHIAHLGTSRWAKLLFKSPVAAKRGNFFAPMLYEVTSAAYLEREVFGPILHVVRFPSSGLEAVVEEINASGYGLTLGVHSRIESRCALIADLVRVGNVYINRNMVGAAVGVQPFGGRGRSGTGPKAGGPFYLLMLVRDIQSDIEATQEAIKCSMQEVPAELSARASEWRELFLSTRSEHVRHWLLSIFVKNPGLDSDSILTRYLEIISWLGTHTALRQLPSPTGEQNTYGWQPRGAVSLVIDVLAYEEVLLIATALVTGNGVIVANEKQPVPDVDSMLPLRSAESPVLRVDAISVKHGSRWIRDIGRQLLEIEQALVPIIQGSDHPEKFMVEKSICINTTAAGGNASLLAEPFG